MSSAHIRFSTEILSRLGEELNPNADQGILELVKNSYDADARTCRVELINTDTAGGTIRIVDDGDGMDAAGIRNGWLVLGRSGKDRKKRTRLGRTPAGSKGLGRLAALRLGKKAFLKTCPKKQPNSVFALEIDWSRFSKAHAVEEVAFNIRRLRRTKDTQQGTSLTIKSLENRISRGAVKRLARALILLADPFGDDPEGFQPTLQAPEYSDLEGLVSARYFSQADYHLVASVNKEGKARARILDWKGKQLWSANHGELSLNRDGARYDCPAATFDLWTFILNSTSFAEKPSSLGEVRSWLSEFGGVHVYENALRVTPYGDPGNDWLNMNLRRAQTPEERPSTNNTIGRVSVEDGSNLLVQKTDRSGFIESEEFEALRRFAQDCLEWMAKRRLELAEEKRAAARKASSKRASRSKRRVQTAIESAPRKVKADLQQAFEAYDRSRDREVGALQREVQLYRTLSTAGITAATFAHESQGNPIKVIVNSTKAIQRRGRKALGKDYEEKLAKPVSSIINAIDSLSVLSTTTLSLVDHTKRRVGRVDIHRVIRSVISTFTPFLEGRRVTVEMKLAGGNPYLRGSEAALESVVTNLLNNSLQAFERAGAGQRRIRISSDVEGSTLTFWISDSGPGIEDIKIREIWLPGITTQPNGTGLGLTIVRDTVNDLNGEVNAQANGELGGATIEIILPIIGV